MARQLQAENQCVRRAVLVILYSIASADPLRFAVMKDPENQFKEFVRVEVQTETTQMLLGCGPGESACFPTYASFPVSDDQHSEAGASSYIDRNGDVGRPGVDGRYVGLGYVRNLDLRRPMLTLAQILSNTRINAKSIATLLILRNTLPA